MIGSLRKGDGEKDDTKIQFEGQHSAEGVSRKSRCGNNEQRQGERKAKRGRTEGERRRKGTGTAHSIFAPLRSVRRTMANTQRERETPGIESNASMRRSKPITDRAPLYVQRKRSEAGAYL